MTTESTEETRRYYRPGDPVVCLHCGEDNTDPEKVYPPSRRKDGSHALHKRCANKYYDETRNGTRAKPRRDEYWQARQYADVLSKRNSEKVREILGR